MSPLAPHRGQIPSGFARVLHVNRVIERDIPDANIPGVMVKQLFREVEAGKLIKGASGREYRVQRDGSIRAC